MCHHFFLGELTAVCNISYLYIRLPLKALQAFFADKLIIKCWLFLGKRCDALIRMCHFANDPMGKNLTLLLMEWAISTNGIIYLHLISFFAPTHLAFCPFFPSLKVWFVLSLPKSLLAQQNFPWRQELDRVYTEIGLTYLRCRLRLCTPLSIELLPCEARVACHHEERD